MPFENDYLPFATGGGANVISQVDWIALAARVTGFEPGLARASQANKAWRQSSVMTAAMAAAIVQIAQTDLIDDGDVAALTVKLLRTMGSAGRYRLTAPTAFYVATAGGGGSDANDGRTPGTPWLTISNAYAQIQANYDLAGFACTLHIADGNYNGSNGVTGPLVGQTSPEAFTISGNIATPGNVVLTSPVTFQNRSMGFLTGFKCVSSGAGISGDNSIIRFQNIDFGACAAGHIGSGPYSRVTAVGDYFVSGNSTSHISAAAGQVQINNGVAVNFTGGQNFTQAFCIATELALVDAGAIWVNAGLVTGQRYGTVLNSVIRVISGGVNYFPGNIAGTDSGGPGAGGGIYTSG